jgi:hypothetical protein
VGDTYFAPLPRFTSKQVVAVENTRQKGEQGKNAANDVKNGQEELYAMKKLSEHF